MAEPPYRVEPANPQFASPDATAVPQWRIDLGRKFVVGDRLAHEKFARFMVLILCNDQEAS